MTKIKKRKNVFLHLWPQPASWWGEGWLPLSKDPTPAPSPWPEIGGLAPANMMGWMHLRRVAGHWPVWCLDLSDVELHWTEQFAPRVDCIVFLQHQSQQRTSTPTHAHTSTLSVGSPEEHTAGKNWVMSCWCGHLSGVRCRLFAYGPADVTAS